MGNSPSPAFFHCGPVPCAITGAPPLTLASLAFEPGLDVDPGLPRQE